MTEVDRAEGLDVDLSAWIDGELAPEREAELRARLAAEPELAARRAALEQVDTAVRSLPMPEPTAGLREGLRERIRAEGAHVPDFGRRRALWLGAAFAAAAALLLFLLTPEAARPPLHPVDGGSLATGDTGDLEQASDEEIGIALDYETLADLDVIEDLELLELMVELEDAGRG